MSMVKTPGIKISINKTPASKNLPTAGVRIQGSLLLVDYINRYLFVNEY
jgi:hypothetical protein